VVHSVGAGSQCLVVNTTKGQLKDSFLSICNAQFHQLGTLQMAQSFGRLVKHVFFFFLVANWGPLNVAIHTQVFPLHFTLHPTHASNLSQVLKTHES